MGRVAKITRRAFLIGAGAVAGGLAVGYWYVSRPYDNPLEAGLGEGEATFNPYVKIGADNMITIIAPRAEMGQGISTTLAAFVAEELDVDLARVSVEHGPASGAYYNAAMLEDAGPFPWFDEGVIAEMARAGLGVAGKALGLQATGGSASTRDGFERMRMAGATARAMLVAVAADRLRVAPGELVTDDGMVLHEASGRFFTYGELAQEAATRSPPRNVRLKERDQWQLLGTSLPRVDMHAKVTGAPIFGVDVQLPDMLFGTVLMSPVFWREPVSYDLTAARAMPGVVAVVPISSINGHGFGVIAQNTWAAFKAAKAIEVEWAAPDYPADGAAIEAALDAALDGDASSVMRSNGDVEVAFAASEGGEVLEATYKVPLLAHACMEPMNATARIAEGRLEIWAPNQMPTITAQVCGAAVGIEDVVVHTTQMGGAFGRREVDFSLYAALLAREVEGRPVKVTWSREEDIRHDMYRPPAKARMRARMGTDGLPQAVEIDIAAPSIIQSILRRTFPSLPVGGPDASITQGASDQPYTIENYRVSGRKAELGIPVGFWRSVGNSFNGYFHESFMDEIAHRGGTDPIELRRRLMADHPEAIAVIDAVAEMSGWSQPPAQGRARGFAFVLSFGSWVAEVVEVSQSPQGIRIEDVWIAADVGLALDPRNIEAQLVSGAVYGLSAAMDEEITLAGGMVEQSNFHDFDAMRMHRCPRFHTRILQNQARMGGVGEIGTPPAAPALANAVFALTGRRVRSLPLSREVRFA